MNASDFVYLSVVKALEAAGLDNFRAANIAQEAKNDYAKNQYDGRPSLMIETAIKKGVKIVKSEERAKKTAERKARGKK